MSHVFVSYSKQDINVVRRLRHRLEKAEIPVWMDERRLSSGDEWWDKIESSIHSACAFVVVMSPNSEDSRWVTRELLIAEGRGLPIFPILIAGKPWSRLGELQYEDLRRTQPDAISRRLVSTLRRLSGVDEQATTGQRRLRIEIKEANLLSTEADVIALKYARTFYGADGVIADLLVREGKVNSRDAINPDINDYTLFDTPDFVPASQVIFVGTPFLRAMGYSGVRDWAARVLSALQEARPETEHIAMTIHGPGFGLDEQEAFRQQIEGILDAMNAGTLPPALQRITIYEIGGRRATRLNDSLAQLGAIIDTIDVDDEGRFYLLSVLQVATNNDQVDTFAPVAPERPNAFVVLPDSPDTEDLFYFGIQQPTHAYGLLCERVETGPRNDRETLPYDFGQARERIDQATLVIVDLSHLHDFVFLQLGYALGRQRPLLLLAHESVTVDTANIEGDLPYIRYRSIKDVEQAIEAFLHELVESGAL